MVSTAKASETYNTFSKAGDSLSVKGTVKIHVSDMNGKEVSVIDLYDGVQIGGGVYEDSFLNQSLNTAKTIFSRLASGDIDYKIGKIAFGNAGHNFDNTKQAGAVSADDTELNAAALIRANLGTSDEFTYMHGGSTYRLVYIEKDILPEHITFGENGNQFIVRVPISFDDFNKRVNGDNYNLDDPYDTSLLHYKLIADDGSLIYFGNSDADGNVDSSDGETHTEVFTNSGTTNYTFKNGLDANGNVDATNGGIRPQELSEILLLTDIIGNGTTEPYKKLAASRMTSGLLSFPEGFQFTYEWTLTWNFL